MRIHCDLRGWTYIFNIGIAEMEVVQQTIGVAGVDAEHATLDVILHKAHTALMWCCKSDDNCARMRAGLGMLMCKRLRRMLCNIQIM